jgi:hypothetical protein
MGCTASIRALSEFHINLVLKSSKGIGERHPGQAQHLPNVSFWPRNPISAFKRQQSAVLFSITNETDTQDLLQAPRTQHVNMPMLEQGTLGALHQEYNRAIPQDSTLKSF